MRQLARLLLLSTAIASATSLCEAQGAPAQDSRPGIAVFPLVNGGSYSKNKQEDLNLLSLGLQQSLINELAVNTNLRVVDRGTLRDLLREQDLGASGRVDPQTAARLGKIVGARYIITGGFIDLYGEMQINGRIIDVSTSEVVRSAQVQGNKKKLFGLLSQLAGMMTAGVHLTPLPAAVRDARIGRTVPSEAMGRYSSILAFRDEGGDPAKAVQLYRALVKDFPQVEEFKSELKQLAK